MESDKDAGAVQHSLKFFKCANCRYHTTIQIRLNISIYIVHWLSKFYPFNYALFFFTDFIKAEKLFSPPNPEGCIYKFKTQDFLKVMNQWTSVNI